MAMASSWDVFWEKESRGERGNESEKDGRGRKVKKEKSVWADLKVRATWKKVYLP